MNKEYPDMEQMIEECRKKQKPEEEIVFAFGVGRIVPVLGKRKAMKQGMDFIKRQEGFKGVYPVDLWHTLLIFDTLNNAKGARNNLKAKGISVGNVVPVLVDEKYLKEGNV